MILADFVTARCLLTTKKKKGQQDKHILSVLYCNLSYVASVSS